jgi:hypothetical protein
VIDTIEESRKFSDKNIKTLGLCTETTMGAWERPPPLRGAAKNSILGLLWSYESDLDPYPVYLSRFIATETNFFFEVKMSIIQKIINERPWSSSSEFFIPFHVCIWILIILFSVWLNSIGGSETPMYIDPVDTEETSRIS